MSLAVAALGGTASVVGLAIARAVEQRVAASLTKHLLHEGSQWIRILDDGTRIAISAEQATAIKEMAPVAARYLAEAAKGVWSDGFKALAGPKVRELLRQGKQPLDAFFEGQKAAAIDGAKQLVDSLEDLRGKTLQTAPDAQVAAEGFSAAANAHYAQAEPVQKDQTLRAWLQYQARSHIGIAQMGNRNSPEGLTETTDIATKLPGQIGGIVADGIPGVVIVDLYPGPKMEHRIMGGALPGLTRAMLTQLQHKPLKDLGLPIVFRIVADQAGRGYAGHPGRPGRGPGAPNEVNQFSVRVDEAGRVFVAAHWPWQRALMAKWVAGDPGSLADVQRGGESIASLAWALTLADLHVQPDKS